MRILKDGCRLYGPEDGKVSAAGNWTGRMVICRDSGAKRITQSVNDYTHGSSRAVVNPNAEEVLYVANGEGACRINGFDYRLRSGTGVFIPPGAVYSIENSGPGTLRIIGACCPEDLQRRFIEDPLGLASRRANVVQQIINCLLYGERLQTSAHSETLTKGCQFRSSHCFKQRCLGNQDHLKCFTPSGLQIP